jgi:hypothetical protein
LAAQSFRAAAGILSYRSPARVFPPGRFCYLFFIVPHQRCFCKHKNGILGRFLRFQV